MSLEVWGDEDPSDIPECPLCEERAAEHEAEARDLTIMVKRLTRALSIVAPDHPLVGKAKAFILHHCEPINTRRSIEVVLEEDRHDRLSDELQPNPEGKPNGP